MSVSWKEVETEWEAASAKRRSAASPLICGVLACPPPEVWEISSLYERTMGSPSLIPTLFSDGLYLASEVEWVQEHNALDAEALQRRLGDPRASDSASSA